MQTSPISKRRGGGGGTRPSPRCRLSGASLLMGTIITMVSLAFFYSAFPVGHREDLPSLPHTKAASGITEGSELRMEHIEPEASDASPGAARGLAEASGTPPCHPHTTEDECTGLCETVGEHIKGKRENKGMWHWYYPNILKYYKCIGAKIVVEVGAAFGGQTQYMLKHSPGTIEEYHVVDPFMAGYDKKDVMSKWMQKAAPDSTPSDISVAWYKSLSLALGTRGEYFDEGMEPAGCRLRMHRLKSVDGAQLFADHSVDAVFIDGLHTYEGVVDDINAWRAKVKPGGALIFNDYNLRKQFGGISKAVQEEAARRNLTPFMIDRTNAVLGGEPACATKPVPF